MNYPNNTCSFNKDNSYKYCIAELTKILERE